MYTLHVYTCVISTMKRNIFAFLYLRILYAISFPTTLLHKLMLASNDIDAGMEKGNVVYLKPLEAKII